MSLGLDIAVTGRKSKTIDAIIERELTHDDLKELEKERGVQKPLTALKRLGARHRSLARYMSLGFTNSECAALLGYDPARVSVIKSDPAFQNLLAIYQAEQDDEQARIKGKMTQALEESVDQVLDTLEHEPEKVSLGMKLEIIKTLGDRTGFGVETISKNEKNINVSFASEMEAARARVERMKKATGDIIDVTPNEEKKDG